MRLSPFLAVSLVFVAMLAGCTSSQDVLEPAAVAEAPPGAATAEAGMPAAPAAPGNPAAASRARLHFDPIVGASVEAATPLTERLSRRARARGISLAGNADPSATHVLKGYFSTVADAGETTVIYVWDVYDPAGNRLHRIEGQQKSPSAGGEGWAAVSAATMQSIADQTIDQLAGWLASQSG